MRVSKASGGMSGSLLTAEMCRNHHFDQWQSCGNCVAAAGRRSLVSFFITYLGQHDSHSTAIKLPSNCHKIAVQLPFVKTEDFCKCAFSKVQAKEVGPS